MLYLLRLFDATVFKILLFGFLITVTIGNGGASATVAPASAPGSGGDTTTGVQNPPSGGTTGGGNPTSPTSAAMVTIPASQDVFSPFILAVQPQTTVTWLNSDTASHVIKTTPDMSSFLNPQPISMTVAAGQQATMTFTQPGVYDYYDSTKAVWNKKDHRVGADKGVPFFPLSMEGVIWVQGHIDGLPSTVKNGMPGIDDFTQDFVAITAGGSVAWHNIDASLHVVSPVPGLSQPINPANIATTTVLGTRNIPGGETKMITFPTPGLYYYYCPPHASLNATFHRALALPKVTEFPIPMEGFVLVSS